MYASIVVYCVNVIDIFVYVFISGGFNNDIKHDGSAARSRSCSLRISCL